jgi:hypothetical protein
MILRMERSGGFTGIPLRAVIDSEQLPIEESRNLHHLVEVSGFFSLPPAIRSPSGADRFSYRLTIEDSGRSHTVEVSEGAAPEHLQALIRQVTVMARSTGRAGN